jgi:uncharacterized protein involved in exopolysaccharide biosynthesis
MNIEVFLRLLKQHIIWFILIPCVTAGTAWYFTRNEVKVYKSQATIYTGLVSRYSLLSDQQNSFMDRSSVALDNLLTTLTSKETLMQVSLRLLTDHLMLQQPDSLVLSSAGFEDLRANIPSEWQPLLMDESDPARLRKTLDSLAKSQFDNPIKTLLFKSYSYYSLQRINENLKATPRKATNDVLQMEYEAGDPAVAKQTLSYAIDALNKRSSSFKTSESKSVVGYYEDKLKEAKRNLDQAEANVRAFSVRHKVLDYDEEARNMAASRETNITEYNQELMRRNAAKASLDALDRKLSQQGNVSSANSDLNEKQRKLTEAESKLANARAYGQPRTVISRLQSNVNQAAEELKASALKYDAASNSSDALPVQTLANDRLEKSLEFEESSARLELYKKRMDEYQAKTDEYSPLGSQLRQLNRALSVAEKEYMALLDNVDQSRTRQQDISVTGSMEIVDAPDFPTAPQASKRTQLVVIGFGVGLFLALLLTALRFWLDKRIYSPEQAEQMIGLPVTAMFPTVRKPLVYSKITRAAQSMFEQLFNAINVEIAQVTTKPYPPIITLFSIRPKQGKTWVASGLIHLYTGADQQVAYCYPKTTGRERREDRISITFFPYTIRPDFMNVTSVDYLIDHEMGFDSSQYDRIILELPPLINNQVPTFLLKGSALSLLIVDANSTWARAEKQLLSLYIRITKQPILAILNRVSVNLVDMSGQPAKGPEPVRPERTLQQ